MTKEINDIRSLLARVRGINDNPVETAQSIRVTVYHPVFVNVSATDDKKNGLCGKVPLETQNIMPREILNERLASLPPADFSQR